MIEDLVKTLALMYILIGSNYTKELYSGQLATFISSNRTAQHTVGLLTIMTILIFLSSNTSGTTLELVSGSIAAYTLFLLTTKMDLQWSIMVIFLMLMILLIEKMYRDKELLMQSDTSLNEADKKNITYRHNIFRSGLLGSLLLVTGIGSYFYLTTKQGQYGGGFSTVDFLFKQPAAYRIL